MSVLGQQMPSRRWRSTTVGGASRRRAVRLVVAIAVLAVVVFIGAKFFSSGGRLAVSDAYSLFITTGLDQNIRVDVASGRLHVSIIRAGTADPRPVKGLAFEMALGVEEMKRIVDAMGGVLINIPETIEYRGRDGLPVRIDAGMRRLDADRVEAYYRRPNSSTTASMRAIVLGIASRAAELTAGGVKLTKLLDASLDEAAKGEGGRNAEKLAGLLSSCTHLGPTDIVVEGPGTVEAASATAAVAPTVEAGAPAIPVPATTVIGPLKIRILNGVGRPGLAARAALRLPTPRYLVIETANADRFGYAGTLVVSSSAEFAQEVIGALGIGRHENRPASGGADVDVILGADMRQL
ncbi:MAG: LytR C-terminal domain-containing protein [Candidatus Hydrogenedentota bacterium]